LKPNPLIKSKLKSTEVRSPIVVGWVDARKTNLLKQHYLIFGLLNLQVISDRTTNQ
jgi:hypothetical protein